MNTMVSHVEPTVSEIYSRIAYDTSCLESGEINGEEKNVFDMTHRDYVLELLRVEELVRSILSSDLPAFKMKEGRLGIFRLERLPLAKYFMSVIELFELMTPEYGYSAHVALFFRCCFELELGKEWFSDPLGNASRPAKQYELYNELIDLIRVESKKQEFRSKMYSQTDKPKKRLISAGEYIDELFNVSSKLQVLRVDLFYQYDAAGDISAEDAKADLQHLLNNRRNKPSLFKNNIGYIWKLEWGPEKGYHFHLIFFYKGRELWKDAYWASLIGEYWKDRITKGRGGYFNCNASKDKYHRLGIGMIDRKDLAKRKILLEDVVGYFTKTDQFLRAVKLGNGDCFGKGEPPQKSNAGRPRDDEEA